MTGVLLFSSGMLGWGEGAVRRGHEATGRLAIIWTIGLGAAFLVFQLAEYRHLSKFTFTLVGAHGAHVLLGLLMLSYVLVQPRIGVDELSTRDPMHKATLFWRVVCAAWIAVVLLLLLLPRIQ